jgi:organic hydroperoxide reductase OsmC/OhrA
LIAAVADCFLLSFRGVARANQFTWTSLECAVEGTLNRIEGKTHFTHIVLRATLRAPEGTDHAKAGRLLERAEHVCLVSNSLVAQRRIETTVLVA